MPHWTLCTSDSREWPTYVKVVTSRSCNLILLKLFLGGFLKSDAALKANLTYAAVEFRLIYENISDARHLAKPESILPQFYISYKPISTGIFNE